jgi:hypothetical protein
MKNRVFLFWAVLLAPLCFNIQFAFAQAPQKLSYQAVVFDSQNALVRNTAVGMRISILQGSVSGDIVFQETYVPNPQTNGNGVVSVEIGTGTPSIGTFSAIDWATGPYFMKSETDLAGGSNYTITGTSEVLSAPYALYANTAGNGFSGDYNDLTNKPEVDGSETKVVAGSNVTVTGAGTADSPYVVNAATASATVSNKVVFTSTQIFTVPQGVSKIKVELWGAAGGGGGGGAYSYSYNLNNGGTGGGGGYASQEFVVSAGQQYNVTVGAGGSAGVNAVYSGGNYYGDTNGGNGGDSNFETLKAAGGKGGKKGSYSYYTVHGDPGTANIGSITAHPAYSGNNTLDIFFGLDRSYLAERRFTSTPGMGGSIYSYSNPTLPVAGEGGAAIISFIE